MQKIMFVNGGEGGGGGEPGETFIKVYWDSDSVNYLSEVDVM